jgi:hypothetical protein
VTYLDYEVSVELNGAEFTGNPGQFFFTISDSIYDLFPRATLHFPDETSLFKSGGLLTDGFPILLKLGINGVSVGCSYVVDRGETESPMTIGYVSGDMTLKLVHKGRSKMSAKSRALVGLVSEIAPTVISPLGFVKTSFEKTRGKSTWWQMGVDEETFLRETLEPASTSYDSQDTPMFFFGDSTDTFNLKSFAAMIGQKEVASYTMVPQSIQAIAQQGFSSLYDLRPFTEGLTPSLAYAKPRVVGYKSTDASLLSSVESIFSHVKGSGDAVPLPAPVGATRFLYLGRQIQDNDEQCLQEPRDAGENDRDPALRSASSSGAGDGSSCLRPRSKLGSLAGERSLWWQMAGRTDLARLDRTEQEGYHAGHPLSRSGKPRKEPDEVEGYHLMTLDELPALRLAKVVSADDSSGAPAWIEPKTGCVKVRIFPELADVGDSDLPWAMPDAVGEEGAKSGQGPDRGSVPKTALLPLRESPGDGSLSL